MSRNMSSLIFEEVSKTNKNRYNITKEVLEEDFYDLYYFVSQFLIARAEIERTYLKVINTEQFVISTQFNNNYIYYYRGNINITNNYYESVTGKVV